MFGLSGIKILQKILYILKFRLLKVLLFFIAFSTISVYFFATTEEVVPHSRNGDFTFPSKDQKASKKADCAFLKMDEVEREAMEASVGRR